MDEREIGVHRTHCCVLHGCKYGDWETCPVILEEVEQEYICETCYDYGINNINDLIIRINVNKKLGKLEEEAVYNSRNGIQTMNVDSELLLHLIHRARNEY